MGKKRFTTEKFHGQSVGLLERMTDRNRENSTKVMGAPISGGLLEIAQLFLQLLPIIEPLLKLCPGKQPPNPGPVPAPLATSGVTQETWEQANGAKFAAEQCKKKPDDDDEDDDVDPEFKKRAVTLAAKQIRHQKGGSLKQAKVTALTALQGGCEEDVDDIAHSMQDAKDSKAALLGN